MLSGNSYDLSRMTDRSPASALLFLELLEDLQRSSKAFASPFPTDSEGCTTPMKDASSIQVLVLSALKVPLALKWSAPCCFTGAWEDSIATGVGGWGRGGVYVCVRFGMECGWALLEHCSIILLKLPMPIGIA